MEKNNYQIKVGFIEGLSEVVEKEICNKTSHKIITREKDYFYLDFIDSFQSLLDLRSVGNVSLVISGDSYNPGYISKHKSILGDMINKVLSISPDKFSTFRISCAGPNSDEVKSILRFIESEFRLSENNEADLKINIFKSIKTWEIAIQVTRRPLSLRLYKVANMSGAMDPTVAYGLNYYCELKNKKSYLNAFSGSSTLLIEALQEFNNLETLVGFDGDKKHLTLGYQNVRKAGFIRKVRLIEQSIFNVPDLGKFDAIVADLPFGMVISKNEDLNSMYATFIDFAYRSLSDNGVVGVYTSEVGTFVNQLNNTKWVITKKIDLKLSTNVNSYIYPSIIICKKK
jgi:16S rRNA G966 N2-methylase RsmD